MRALGLPSTNPCRQTTSHLPRDVPLVPGERAGGGCDKGPCWTQGHTRCFVHAVVDARRVWRARQHRSALRDTPSRCPRIPRRAPSTHPTTPEKLSASRAQAARRAAVLRLCLCAPCDLSLQKQSGCVVAALLDTATPFVSIGWLARSKGLVVHV